MENNNNVKNNDNNSYKEYIAYLLKHHYWCRTKK